MTKRRGLILLVILGGACLFWVMRGCSSPSGQPGLSEVVETSPEEEAKIRAAKHPLLPGWEMAKQAKEHLEKDIRDYSATFVKRERIEGVLSKRQSSFVKIRHQPFSAYMYTMEPTDAKGQEVIYVDGRNDGNLVAHAAPSDFWSFVGAVRLDPKGKRAMQGQHYPITEIGMLNLCRRLMQVAQEDMQHRGECDVEFIRGAKVNDRTCTCVRVVHPVRRDHFRFHLAQIFVDDELKLPVRYESYDWPKQPGEAPELIEEFTYLDLKLNQGFSDADFDQRNPKYGFQ